MGARARRRGWRPTATSCHAPTRRFDLVVAVPRPRAAELAAATASARREYGPAVEARQRRRRAAGTYRGSERASRPRGRTAGRSRGAAPRASREWPARSPRCCVRSGRGRAPRRGALLPSRPRSWGSVSDLAPLLYASASGRHLVRRPADSRFGIDSYAFDEQAERARLAAAGFARSLGVRLSHAARDDPDPREGPLHPRFGARRAPRDGVGGRRRRPGLLGVRASRRAFDLGWPGPVWSWSAASREASRGNPPRCPLDGGGATVAVLGCGSTVTTRLPPAELARRICRDGLIVSEYGSGVEPAPWRFPARNRIIAGLAGPRWSWRPGTKYALTPPTSVSRRAATSSLSPERSRRAVRRDERLLRLGATPLLRVDDVLELLGLEPPKRALGRRRGGRRAATARRFRGGSRRAGPEPRGWARAKWPLHSWSSSWAVRSRRRRCLPK